MKKQCLILLLLPFLYQLSVAQEPYQFNRYHQPADINQYLREANTRHTDQTKLHLIGHSWSGVPVYLLEIGTETAVRDKSIPAVFVAANFEGTQLLASEGAVWLMQHLLDHPEKYQHLTWYILPSGNPEAAQRYFDSPSLADQRNFRPFNDDNDDQIDEDPAEDLNGDGYITQMRVQKPGASMIPDSTDARRLRKADPLKGEKGVYTVYTEGVDSDGDGQYNEDGAGGTNNGISFPHLFDHQRRDNGDWPGQEEEVFGVMEFMTKHPEIALVMYYGASNFCLVPPKSGRKGGANLSSIKIPGRYATMLQADPDKSYSMEEVKAMVRNIVPPGTTVDDAMVAGMLSLGAVVNPLPKDGKLYSELSKAYHKYLKEKGADSDRLDPDPAKDGSFELWAYYHLGLPSFSQDFWGVPVLKNPVSDTVKQKNPADPDKKSPAAKSKKPDKEATFLAYNDSILKGKGFVDWETFDHPELGTVDIGGIVPYADLLPPADSIHDLLKVQVPWIFELVSHLPKLTIEEYRLTPKGGDIYRLEAWFRNDSKFHFPTAMGSRNGTPPPAIVFLEGKKLELLEGLTRTPIKNIDAGSAKKLSWLIRCTSDQVELSVKPVNAYGSVKTIQISGGK